MAQEVHLMGATYSDVPSISLPDSNGNYHSFVDATTVASSWTKVAETTYTVSTTNTSVAEIDKFETGDTSIWTSSAFVWVRIRDTAGKRTGYFYGSDSILFSTKVINGSTSNYTSIYNCFAYRYTTDGEFVAANSTYGIYSSMLYSDGRVRIYSKYHSTHSLTIDGTYKVEVYLLTPPATIFE